MIQFDSYLKFRPFFNLGVFIDLGPWQGLRLGFGLVELAVHRMSYGKRPVDPKPDWDIYLSVPFGHVGVSIGE